MRVKVKFLSSMTKNGKIRKPGDILEIDATQAILLAKKGNVVIEGYEIKKETKTVEVDTLVEVKK